MFRKTLLATAAAGMLATGSLVAATSTASAHGPGAPNAAIQFGGPGWNVQIGNWGPGFAPQFPQKPPKFCTPVVKNVKWWDKWGRPHWSAVVVSYTCKAPGHHNHGPWNGPGGPGGFPGGPGFPGGSGPGWSGNW